MEAVHDLLNAGAIVPLCETGLMISIECNYMRNICNSTHPVQVEDVDIGRAQLLERLLDGNLEGLHVVANVVCLLLDVLAAAFRVGRVLCRWYGHSAYYYRVQRSVRTDLSRDDHLVTDSARLHPFADELLRALVLVVAGSINEVAASV